MAKKKTVTVGDVKKLYAQLHFNDQQEFVDSLPAGQIVKHPWVMSYLNGNDMEVEIAKSKRPKKRGKPERDTCIIRLSKAGQSDGQIMLDPEVMRLNGGLAMDRDAVQSVRRRKGIKKK